jgi:hypothetical protein
MLIAGKKGLGEIYKEALYQAQGGNVKIKSI